MFMIIVAHILMDILCVTDFDWFITLTKMRGNTILQKSIW